MGHPLTRLAAAAACLLFAASCGFASNTCVAGIRSGDAIHITLLEPYSPSSTYTWDASHAGSAAGPSCAGSDALAPGTSFDVTLSMPYSDASLACAPLRIYPTSTATPSIAFRMEDPGQALSDIGPGTVGFKTLTGDLPSGCATGWDITIQAIGTDAFAHATPGTAPPVLVHRVMASSAAGCPRMCQDLWVAQLDRGAM